MGFLILNHDADAFRQERYIRDLNLKFTKIIELAKSAKSAQAAAETLYKESKNAPSKNGLINNLLSKHLGAQARNEYCNQGEPRNSDY